MSVRWFRYWTGRGKMGVLRWFGIRPSKPIRGIKHKPLRGPNRLSNGLGHREGASVLEGVPA